MTERLDGPVLDSPRSPRVTSTRALSRRSSRQRQNAFRVEGPQAVLELLRHRPATVTGLYATEQLLAHRPDLARAAADAGLAIRAATDRAIAAMCDTAAQPGTVTPQGVVATAHLLGADLADALTGATTIAVLAGVADPGNAGTVLRAADAAGADAAVLTTGSVDVHNPKVVRSAAGSLFHLPVVTGADPDQALGALAAGGFTTCGTSPRGETELFAMPPAAKVAWIFGAEAHGLDDRTLAACDLRVAIPMPGRAESLNLAMAATLCLFETVRSRRA